MSKESPYVTAQRLHTMGFPGSRYLPSKKVIFVPDPSDECDYFLPPHVARGTIEMIQDLRTLFKQEEPKE